MKHNLLSTIIIIDFGGQYTHLIAKRIRLLGLFSKIIPPEDYAQESKSLGPALLGIILSGGPKSVSIEDSSALPLSSLLELQVPILGICFGHQLLAHLFGGKVEHRHRCEYGQTFITITTPNATLFKEVPTSTYVWMGHSDSVTELPSNDFTITATSAANIVAYEHKTRPIFGVQFHPEVTHSECGATLLQNFVSLCSTQRQLNWNPQTALELIIQEIKQKVADKKVILFISGGVDSLVALALCRQALFPAQILPVHIDTGLMRKNESADVCSFLHSIGCHNLKLIQAEEHFLLGLQKLTSPEEKRKIIGKIFVDLFHNTLPCEGDWMLVQGTIYPDVIESGHKHNGNYKAQTIKTHHNRVDEIQTLSAQGRLLEPLKDLYKDEVREIGKLLNLPLSLLNRHPFPGPGLAIRVIATDKTILPPFEKITTTLESSFEVSILPFQSVGVQGDERTYRRPLLLQSIHPIKGLDLQKVTTFAHDLLNKNQQVNRALLSLTGKNLSLKLLPTSITKKQLDHLREIDAYIHSFLETSSPLHAGLWQMPIAALPLYNEQMAQAYVMRPISSVDGMTANLYEFSMEKLSKLAITLCTDFDSIIAELYLDLTSKPPATIEWE
ncbi:MAG: glutamine-hydrolyzing GMP synthase [Oligoflexia bacterium]|nr:glutamine-hydrolyzing GMP synthase [Oligoflexia bacterium]MBF0364661.1 glutamine-hydrolyzing GMP synthase [Oligoflexia bacterium]